MFSKVKLIAARWATEFDSLPRRLKQTLGGIIAIALVIGAIFLGRTIHHHVADQPAQPKKPVTVQVQKAKPAPASSPTKSSGSVASNSKSTQVNNSKSSSGAIANTGPGDVAAIFVGVSAAGALAHFSVSRRHQNS